MNEVSIKEARRRLSDLVDAAERGESVVITRRGRQVARLGPARSKPVAGLPDLSRFRSSIKVKGKPLSKAVIDAREETRY